MPTERCNKALDQIGVADICRGVFDNIHGKVMALVGTLIASSSYWVDHLPFIAQVAGLIGGAIIWGMTVWASYLRIKRERMELRELEEGH